MKFQNLSFKTKILTIFFLPTIALVYFSFYFVQIKYANLQQSKKYEFLSQKTQQIMSIIRDIQVERGLGAGYLVADNDLLLKKRLLAQYKKTDTTFNMFQVFATIESQKNADLIDPKTYKHLKPILRDFFTYYQKLGKIRNKVLKKDFSVEEEINYYTTLNKKLINVVQLFASLLHENNYDSFALLQIELLKEYAGLERACVYNQVISETRDQQCLEKISYLQQMQKDEEEQFFLYASETSTKTYFQIIDQKNIQELKQLRKLFSQNKLHKNDAQKWFEVTTQRIDNLNDISKKILQHYITISAKQYNKSWNDLALSLAMWILFIISALYIVKILNQLFKKEQEQLHELRIASYTFDSHEAMVITDTDGTILKVNNGFERITGYSKEEAIGNNPRVLKSGKHPDSFYEDIWKKIIEVGNWNGDIYNKRKNGEIYLERLSITAIKDDTGKTTNYIAQFLDISDLKKAQEEAQYQANHDFLTHLINRKALIEKLQELLEQATRYKFQNAFLFIDLDHFKQVNDTYGHDVGDKLLIHVAEFLQSSVRQDDIVARISGDEFGIILLHLDEDPMIACNVVENIAGKIVTALMQPITLDNCTVEIGCSIGIRLFPKEGDSVEMIIKDADTSMYAAKKNGKNRFVFC